MAVGVHAVERANTGPDDVPLVVGCGPVGLAVIAALKLKGLEPIVATDFSPARRGLARTMGADIVVDPAETSPYTCWEEAAQPSDEHPAAGLALPVFGPSFRPGVFFECVGVPGILRQLVEGAARGSRIVVVGVCMESDHFEPLIAINKEISMEFVLAYTPLEFAETLQHIAEGRILVEPLISGTVGLAEVPGAFKELATPDRHAKIIVDPQK